MEISVYLSTKFANENSPISKVEGITKTRPITKNRRGEQEQKEHDLYRTDPTSTTTLKKLYEDGWRLVSTERSQITWMMLFLERDI